METEGEKKKLKVKEEKKEKENQCILLVVACDQSGDQNQFAEGILLCFSTNSDSL